MIKKTKKLWKLVKEIKEIGQKNLKLKILNFITSIKLMNANTKLLEK